MIIGGHTHVVLNAPEVVAGVPIVQAGWFGHYLGRVTVDVDANGNTASVTGSLQELKA